MVLSIHREGERTDRASPSRCTQSRARHRLEGTSAAVRTVSQTCGTQDQPQQDRGGDRARARRLCVGHCATRQAHLIDAPRPTQKGGSAPVALTLRLDRRGDALAVGESSDGLLDRDRCDTPDVRARQLRDEQQSCGQPTPAYQFDRPSSQMSPSPRLSGLLVATMLRKAEVSCALLTTEAISIRRSQVRALVGEPKYSSDCTSVRDPNMERRIFPMLEIFEQATNPASRITSMCFICRLR